MRTFVAVLDIDNPISHKGFLSIVENLTLSFKENRSVELLLFLQSSFMSFGRIEIRYIWQKMRLLSIIQNKSIGPFKIY